MKNCLLADTFSDTYGGISYGSGCRKPVLGVCSVVCPGYSHSISDADFAKCTVFMESSTRAGVC